MEVYYLIPFVFFSLGLKFSVFFSPSVWKDKCCVVGSCFLPKGQEGWFSLNHCIRRWTARSQEERCLYPHTGTYPPRPIWWCWPEGAPTGTGRGSGICFWFALQTHTLSPGSAFWHLCWWGAPASGRPNALGISQETAVGRWWSTNLGTGSPGSHPDIWLHGWCHLCSKTTWFCLYALTLEGERQEDLRVIRQISDADKEIWNLYSSFPIQAPCFL